MDINIKTKFNIGDKVYSFTCYDGVHSAINCAYEVVSAEIHIGKTLAIYYDVLMTDLLMVGSYAEDNLFATYEECVQWCNEHNC